MMKNQNERILMTLTAMLRLLENRFMESGKDREPKVAEEDISTNNIYEEKELVTIKEAMGILGVSRWKIFDMRKKGQFTKVERDGWKRLIKAEVEAARIWYSVPKGKV
jgi:predicted DNA-binding transcriptional regulator AlpA